MMSKKLKKKLDLYKRISEGKEEPFICNSCLWRAYELFEKLEKEK